jgi:spore coat polysaccharide biosynthesis protein SpsF (cytidylyltransferase family)
LIQARSGSSRLPEKVLLNLEGKTVLERVVERVQRCNKVDEVIVVTTIKKEDLKIVKISADYGICVFCGSEDDVLDRFYQAAKLIKPKNIIRITADCPLIDPDIIDMVIERHIKEDSDYTANCIVESYPDGLDVEVFKFGVLERTWLEAKLKSEREHVTPFIKKHPEIFKIISLVNETDLSEKRWTLDNSEDYEFIKKIYQGIFQKKNDFRMNDVLNFLKENPDLEKLNSSIIRNEGYQKSLKEDNLIK